MKPIRTKVTTAILGAPEGWDAENHGECKGLPVCLYDGVIYSYWKASFWERLKMLFGRPIKLAVFRSVMPPIAIEVAPKDESATEGK